VRQRRLATKSKATPLMASAMKAPNARIATVNHAMNVLGLKRRALDDGAAIERHISQQVRPSLDRYSMTRYNL